MHITFTFRIVWYGPVDRGAQAANGSGVGVAWADMALAAVALALLLDLLEDMLKEPAGLVRGEKAMRVVRTRIEFFEAQLYELCSFSRHRPS